MIKVKILGINGSIREEGNSDFLLKKSLEAAKQVLPDNVETESYSVASKVFYPCDFCMCCSDFRECAIKDDFQELQEKWLKADGIIYSIPVYHMTIPANFKAFLDRLGNTMYSSSSVMPKYMKAIGTISQGTDLGGGGELTVLTMISHALVMGCVPISGDMPESYIGAIGWTKGLWFPDAFKRLIKENDLDAQRTLRAAESMGRRTAYMSLVIRNGVEGLEDIISKDPAYAVYLDRIHGRKE